MLEHRTFTSSSRAAIANKRHVKERDNEGTPRSWNAVARVISTIFSLEM
jgi:hypothetical protein